MQSEKKRIIIIDYKKIVPSADEENGLAERICSGSGFMEGEKTEVFMKAEDTFRRQAFT